MKTEITLSSPTPLANDGDNLRLPQDAWAWDEFQGPLHLTAVAGAVEDDPIRKEFAGDYPERTVRTVARLMHEHRAHYDEAVMVIAPEAWRLLYYIGNYTLEALATPRFHPGTALRALYNVAVNEAPPPEDFLKSGRSIEGIAGELDATLACLDAPVHTAIWTVLAVAQAINLNKAEILACDWWHPYWVRHLAAQLDQPEVRAVA